MTCAASDIKDGADENEYETDLFTKIQVVLFLFLKQVGSVQHCFQFIVLLGICRRRSINRRLLCVTLRLLRRPVRALIDLQVRLLQRHLLREDLLHREVVYCVPLVISAVQHMGHVLATVRRP